MNAFWNPSLDQVIEAIELAKANGKKEGDNYEAEFIQVMNKYNQKPFSRSELTKEEWLQEQVSHGQTILDMSTNSEGVTKLSVIKKEENS
jgi:hypothetical protein